MERPEKAKKVLDTLEEEHPDATIYLDYDNAFQLLIATILAAQCTDERVNKVTPTLFEKYPTPEDLAGGDEEEIQELVRSTGFYRRKTNSIQKVSRGLVEEHDGEVPADAKALAKLSGVGRKTANVVVSNAYDQQAIAVDTHVKRVSRRIGLAGSKNPDKIEKELCEVIPEARWTRATQLIGTHGRRICTSRSPDCENCPVNQWCDYYQSGGSD